MAISKGTSGGGEVSLARTSEGLLFNELGHSEEEIDLY
jgi:hypothetical protein